MQESVKVIVETKTGTSFDFDQINRHLDGLKKVEHGLLILLSPTVEQSLNENRTPDNKPLLSTTFRTSSGALEAVLRITMRKWCPS